MSLILICGSLMVHLQGSPATPPNSHSSSVSDQPASWLLPEEFDSGAGQAYYAGEKELAGYVLLN